MSEQKENKGGCEHLRRKKVFRMWSGTFDELWCNLHKQYLMSSSCQACAEFRQKGTNLIPNKKGADEK